MYAANTAPVVNAGPDQVVSLPTTIVSAPGIGPRRRPAGEQRDHLDVVGRLRSGTRHVREPVHAGHDGTASDYWHLRPTVERERRRALCGRRGYGRAAAGEPAPLVSAGPDQRVLSLATTLAGSVSDDGKPLGGSLQSTWSVVSGPAAVSFANPASASTAVTFGAPGTYVLRLDGHRRRTHRERRRRGRGEPRQRAASRERRRRRSRDGRGLYARGPGERRRAACWQHPDLAVVPCERPWSGELRKRSFADHDRSVRGGRRLHAPADGHGWRSTASDDVTFSVSRVNQAPVVEAGSSQAVTLPIRSVALAGSATDDGLPSGSALAYRWSRERPGPGHLRQQPQREHDGVLRRAGLLRAAAQGERRRALRERHPVGRGHRGDGERVCAFGLDRVASGRRTESASP